MLGCPHYGRTAHPRVVRDLSDVTTCGSRYRRRLVRKSAGLGRQTRYVQLWMWESEGSPVGMRGLVPQSVGPEDASAR